MCDLISVVVPVYNTGLYLEKCIKSITQQDYPNIEITVEDLVPDNFNSVDAMIELITKAQE